MPGQYNCNIPTSAGNPMTLILRSGQSTMIVGANGAGKTRLGAYIESALPGDKVQRIAAQKSLTMSDEISIVSLEKALHHLRFGHPNVSLQHKLGNRWGNKPAIHFLSDFQGLLESLFANHNRIASEHLQERKSNPDIPVPVTEIEKLKTIWDQLLPHRVLKIYEAAVRVSPPDGTNVYAGSEMSDGERAIFYFLGQCLLAPADGVVIIDEPEAHIHRVILEPLWAAIEKSRPDCSYLYITHDLDFAAAHSASNKYFIRSYSHSPTRWEIEELPENTGLPEQVIFEIVGSRKSILFVEGERGSLDLAIYRNLFPKFTIVPLGSCEAVIHSVASFKRAGCLHWLTVSGIVDRDHRDTSQAQLLEESDVHVLPVAEVENLLLLPDVFLTLGEALFCENMPEMLQKLTDDVMSEANQNRGAISARYTKRQIDRRLKRLELKGDELCSLNAEFQKEIIQINPAQLYGDFESKLVGSIQSRTLDEVLQVYDNKGLLTTAARHLGVGHQKNLLEKLGRLLGSGKGDKLREELAKVLPRISSE